MRPSSCSCTSPPCSPYKACPRKIGRFLQWNYELLLYLSLVHFAWLNKSNLVSNVSRPIGGWREKWFGRHPSHRDRIVMGYGRSSRCWKSGAKNNSVLLVTIVFPSLATNRESSCILVDLTAEKMHCIAICETQSHSVHWLSSTILSCLFVCPSAWWHLHLSLPYNNILDHSGATIFQG